MWPVPLDDRWWRWVIDFGLPGPDRGQGGKYLILPRDYDGPLPAATLGSRLKARPPWDRYQCRNAIGHMIPISAQMLEELLRLLELEQRIAMRRLIALRAA
jgi:hypothetical protein